MVIWRAQKPVSLRSQRDGMQSCDLRAVVAQKLCEATHLVRPRNSPPPSRANVLDGSCIIH
jgi:hypothetical protein